VIKHPGNRLYNLSKKKNSDENTENNDKNKKQPNNQKNKKINNNKISNTSTKAKPYKENTN